MAEMESLSLRGWVFVLLLILLAGAGWYFWSQIEEQTAKIQDLDVDLSMQGIELVQAGQEGKKWQLRAKRARYEKGKEIIDLSDPKIIFYFAGSNNTIQVQAPEGRVNQKENQAELWPEVQAEYANSTLYTERLHYIGEKKQAELIGGVTIKSRQLSAQSRQGRIDLEKEHLYLQGDVEVILNDELNVNASKNK